MTGKLICTWWLNYDCELCGELVEVLRGDAVVLVILAITIDV